MAENMNGNPETQKLDQKKRMQNLVSAIILLSGLFIGSLFVDVAQLVNGSGFSEKNLSQSDIFESGSKTWVAYSEPMVKLSVISDETCEKCDPAEALVWLRRVTPTISPQKVDYQSEEGKRLVEKFEIKTLPAFIFAQEIKQTDFYAQAQVLFNEKEDQLELKTLELGLSPGKYVQTPEISESDIAIGNKDSSLKVVIFSDFQCPYCKAFFSTLRQTIEKNKDRALFAYKHLPLSFHTQANAAALSAECAQEQGKFWEYGDKLFAAQAEWSGDSDNEKFKDYAKEIGLEAERFNQCLDTQKYQGKVDADKQVATEMDITGTPATFVGGQFLNGVVNEEDFQKAVDEELVK